MFMIYDGVCMMYFALSASQCFGVLNRQLSGFCNDDIASPVLFITHVRVLYFSQSEQFHFKTKHPQSCAVSSHG